MARSALSSKTTISRVKPMAGRSVKPSPVKHLEPRVVEATRLLKLLSNEQRLTVLCRLSDGELSVTQLGEFVDLSQSALSQHLAKMRADGLVATRRDAQTIYYRLADPIAERLISVLCELYGGHR
ncbi:MAG: ArsR family transcriptional regulator [Alphaproteobacteria bacterium]|nr:MAG: ArsR family transcriptional regulator [Caulobacteraceae bacterium]TPW08637.1 MAG: ArsR family transcriptional regulator [Alphaproteobacteria bacterium]